MKRRELPPKKPAQLPTTERPGSDEKIAILIARYENKEELFHDNDTQASLEKAPDSQTWYASLTDWERLIFWDYTHGKQEEERAERYARRKESDPTYNARLNKVYECASRAKIHFDLFGREFFAMRRGEGD